VEIKELAAGVDVPPTRPLAELPAQTPYNGVSYCHDFLARQTKLQYPSSVVW
jgi:hypothetical protein